jgi:CRP/FNR family transcriptional regulator, dissimilatory nitrate respiration regulator
MPKNLALNALLPSNLIEVCSTEHYPAGDKLFVTGRKPTWMFYVADGEVTLERHAQDGKTLCLQRCSEGFVGEASLTSSKYHCDAIAHQPSTVVKVPLLELRQSLAHDSEFALRWIQMLNQEVRSLRLQNERLALPKVQDRLIHLIETEGNNGIYVLQHSIKEIAKRLAVTHEALYRAIGQLETQGKLARENKALKAIQQSFNLKPPQRQNF